MNLLKFNLRRYTYLILGWGFYLSAFIGGLTFFKHADPNPTIITYIAFVCLYIIFFLLCLGLENWVGKKHYSFLYVPIWTTKVLKNIYHIDLGYFIIRLVDDETQFGISFKLNAYEQGFLSMKVIFKDSTIRTVSEDEVSIVVKKELGEIYREKIRQDKQKEQLRKIREQHDSIVSEARKNLKKWDGFLDKQSRRDGRIDSLIKK